MPSPFLNAPDSAERLDALREIAERNRGGARPALTGEVNNHVHTIYSFSPYSPAATAERAVAAGLAAVGVMDHDSISGADEMRAAGHILEIATTAGVELRVSAAGTPLEGRKINNPDSIGILYMMIHGVPSRSLAAVREFLQPIQASRHERDQRMVRALNALLPRFDLPVLDWDRDVYQQSQASEGGTITERHVLFAVARSMERVVGRGRPLVMFLRQRLGLSIPARLEDYLADPDNPYLLYDLLGLLKSSFLQQVFIQPDDRECIPVERAVRFAEEAGAIPCYGYLGDVTDSPTGDKKAEKFEDSFLDELMPVLRGLGFRAIAYMPPRNTREQLLRVRRLCAANSFMEISGVDVNSPRQSFNCPELLLPEFSHLVGATWALIAHERLGDLGAHYGLFHPDNPLAGKSLEERIEAYAAVGRSLDPEGERDPAREPLVLQWGRGPGHR